MRRVAAVLLLAVAAGAALLAVDLRGHGDDAVARRVLGTGTQLQLRDALRRYPRSRDTLQRVAASGQPRLASQALDLLALLDYKRDANRAVADLRSAIRLDPENDTAKANLELVLRLLVAQGARPGSAAASGPRSQGAHGAGSATRGGGY
jgi:hypothetical protein